MFPTHKDITEAWTYLIEVARGERPYDRAKAAWASAILDAAPYIPYTRKEK